MINEIDAMMSESEVEGESSSGAGSSASEVDTPTSDPGGVDGADGGGCGGVDDRLHFKERTQSSRPGDAPGGAGAMSPNSYKEMIDESGERETVTHRQRQRHGQKKIQTER